MEKIKPVEVFVDRPVETVKFIETEKPVYKERVVERDHFIEVPVPEKVIETHHTPVFEE